MANTIILTQEARDLAESVMKSAGSALRHYMPSTKAEIVEACQIGIDKAQDDLLHAAEKMIEMLNKHGDWDEGCFYYNKTSAQELWNPFILLKTAIAKAKGK